MPRALNVYNQARQERRLWTPALEPVKIAGWYDASDLSTLSGASGVITDWRDKSQYGNHLTQATSTKRPTHSINGLNSRPAIMWDGATGATAKSLQKLSGVTGFTAGAPIHAFVAAQLNSSPGTDSVSLFQFNRSGLAAQDWQISEFVPITLSTHGTVAILTAYEGVFGFIQDEAVTYNLPSIWNVNATATTYGFVDNGVAGTPASYTYPAGGAAQAPTAASFGHQCSDTSFRTWAGPLGECIWWNGLMSLRERQRMEGYLAWKWGLVNNFPGNHPFKNRPPLIGD